MMDRLTGRPLSIAHRGLQLEKAPDGKVHIYPENTLPAFRRAAEVGADAVELDVIAVKDQKGKSHLMVHHDDKWGKIFKRPDSDILVKETPYEEATQATFNPSGFRSRMTPKVADEGTPEVVWEDAVAPSVPELQEVVDAIRAIKPDMKFFIEMKTIDWRRPVDTQGMEAELARFIRKNKLQKQATAISFNPWSLKKMKQLAPEIRTGLDISPEYLNRFKDEQLPLLMKTIRTAVGVDVVMPCYAQASKAFVEAAHRVKMAVLPWVRGETLEGERQAFAKLRQDGVDGIVTNAAGELNAFLQA